jgi:DNA polymerase III epsilon subunit-like protein
MRRLAEVRRRRQVRAALARADLPEPVRVHLSTPSPPDRLPWRQATFTVLDLETTGLDPASDAIVAAGGLRVLDGRAAAATKSPPRRSASTACCPESLPSRRR